MIVDDHKAYLEAVKAYKANKDKFYRDHGINPDVISQADAEQESEEHDQEPDS